MTQANKPDAAKPAVASRLQAGHQGRGLLIRDVRRKYSRTRRFKCLTKYEYEENHSNPLDSVAGHSGFRACPRVLVLR